MPPQLPARLLIPVQPGCSSLQPGRGSEGRLLSLSPQRGRLASVILYFHPPSTDTSAAALNGLSCCQVENSCVSIQNRLPLILLLTGEDYCVCGEKKAFVKAFCCFRGSCVKSDKRPQVMSLESSLTIKRICRFGGPQAMLAHTGTTLPNLRLNCLFLHCGS